MDGSPSWLPEAHRYICKVFDGSPRAFSDREGLSELVEALRQTDVDRAASAFRESILREISEEPVRAVVGRARATLLDALIPILSSPNTPDYLRGREIVLKTQEVEEGLTLLEKIFCFQKQKWDRYVSTGMVFTPASQADFMRLYPEYGAARITFVAKLEGSFGKDFATLIEDMGFPVTARKEVRMQITIDRIWEVYNQLNGLDPRNRQHEPGRIIPGLAEMGISIHFFNDFGGLGSAMDRVLRERTFLDAEDNDPNATEVLLEASIKQRKIPNELSEATVVRVQGLIMADFLNAVEAMGSRILQQTGWEILFFKSKYLSQFGAGIYWIWLTEDQRIKLADHKNRRVAKILHRLLSNQRSARHMVDLYEYYEIPQDLPSQILAATKEKRAGLIADLIGREVNVASGLLVSRLQRMIDMGLPIRPVYAHLIHDTQETERAICSLEEKMAFFRERGDIPLYMQLIILHASKTSIQDIKDRIHLFEESGVDSVLYRHFLAGNSNPDIHRKLGALLGVQNTYRQLLARQAQKRPGKQQKKRETTLQVQAPATESITKPPETKPLQPNDEPDGESRDELDVFLVERGLDHPPTYIKHGRQRVLEIIREIEERGVRFTNDLWWVINAPKATRDASVEEAWRKRTKLQRFHALEHLFGYTGTPKKIVQNRDPDALYKYARIVRPTGIPFSSMFNVIHTKGAVHFRSELAKKVRTLIQKSSQAGLDATELTRWLNQYEKIEQFKAECTGCDGLELDELMEGALPEELDDLSTTLVPILRERRRKRIEVEEACRYARYSYCEMEFFNKDEERQDFLLSYTWHNRQLRRSIPVEELYLAWEAYQDGSSFNVNSQEERPLNHNETVVLFYLLRLGCYEPLAYKVALLGEELEVVRQKVDFLLDIKLKDSIHGLSHPQMEDIEEYLDKPYSYIARYATRRISRKRANDYAQKRLLSTLGIAWDRTQGHISRQISASGLWEKYLYVAEDEAARLWAERSPDGLAQAAELSLVEMRAFASQLRESLKGVKDQDTEAHIAQALRIVFFIASGLTKAWVSPEKMRAAIQAFLNNDSPLLVLIRRKIATGLAPNEAWLCSAEEVHQMILTNLAVASVPLDETKLDGQALWTRCKEGDIRAKNILLEKYDYIAQHQAKKYQTVRYSYEDGLQEGRIGLLRAMGDYDPTRGSFSNYALWWVRAYVLSARRSQEGNIRLPGNVHGVNMDLVKAAKKLGDNPSDEALASASGHSLALVRRVRGAMALTEVPLDAPLRGKDGDGTEEGLHKILGDQSGAFADEMTEGLQASLTRRFEAELRIACQSLRTPERSLDIFRSVYPLGTDSEGETLTEVGERYGLSRERIRQILEQVRNIIRGNERLIEMLQGMSNEY